VPPHFGLDAGFSFLHFDYREYRKDGQQFNRESGYIPGVVLNLGRTAGAWDILGTLSYYGADINYHGETQFGAPVRTTTKEGLYAFALQIGKQVILASTIAPVRVYGEIGYRHWERDIRSTSIATGPIENYRWHYASVGATVPVVQASWGEVAFDARISRTFDSSIDVSFRNLYESVYANLGNRNGFRFSLPISLPLRPKYVLHIEPFLEEWAFGSSNTVNLTQNGSIVGTLLEPRSETRTTGITVSLQKLF